MDGYVFMNVEETSQHEYNMDLYKRLALKIRTKNSIHTWMAAKEVDDFLGILDYRNYFDIHRGGHSTWFNLSPEAKARVEAFLGPHGDALLKAYIIQKDLPDDAFR